MPIYKHTSQDTTKPKSLINFLIDKEKEWEDVSKLKIEKLGKHLWSHIMHNDAVDEKAKHCINDIMKSSNMEYDDLVDDEHSWFGMSEEDRKSYEQQWVEKFTPVAMTDKEEHKPKESD